MTLRTNKVAIRNMILHLVVDILDPKSREMRYPHCQTKISGVAAIGGTTSIVSHGAPGLECEERLIIYSHLLRVIFSV